MKKIICVFFCFFIMFYNIEGDATKLKQIDLNFSSNALFITFFKLNNSTSVFFRDNKYSNLFLLKYESSDGLSDCLGIFKSEPDIYFLHNNISKKIDNIYVYKNFNKFSFRINNFSLCIYSDKYYDVSKCNYIYIMDLNDYFVVPKGVSVLFYDSDISRKYLKNIQESWVESYIVENDSFSILSIDEESYNIMIIPSTKN